MDYRIISYNVNGIRSAGSKGLLDWRSEVDPDILCFQELKANPDDLEDKLRNPDGYHAFWNPAEKKGYSGVGVWSKVQPLHVEYGCGHADYDREGRVIRLDFPEFSLLNVYLPSGSSGEDRQGFKEEFMKFFHAYIAELLSRFPKLVICGDINICHQNIDIHNPSGNKNNSGFLPHEREWVTSFLGLGLIDTFRLHHVEPHRYSWWSFRFNSRAQNKGWRIDYHFASEPLRAHVTDANIFEDAKHSDHAPIYVKLSF